MPVDVILPKVDMDMESAIIESWKVANGQKVEKGDILFEIITNKAAMEVDSPASGVIGAISGAIGEPIAVGTVVALIFREGEQIIDRAPSQPAATVAPLDAKPAPQPANENRIASPEQTAPQSGDVRATPLARNAARELKLDLGLVRGSGPRGRISEKDVRAAAAGAPTEGDASLIPFDAIRRIAAARLTDSVRNAPHFYMTADIDMTAFNQRLDEARREARDAGGAKPSPTVLLAHIAARVLKAHPLVAASVVGNAYRLRERIDIAIAMDRDGALVTPVLRDADSQSLAALSAEFARLVAAARARTIKPSELTGGAFTISNLGMFGVDSFTAIINPPQSAILAVGRTQDRPVGRNGEIVLRPMSTLSLSSDHRVVDGVTAARFMADLRSAIEGGVS